ncbi:MAG: universal stress protein [Deltaproteobacteria bacterium]|nr:universal stress protein [Deltaproteobacteria bacterium]
MRVELKTIMCTTDFSDYSNHAVSYATALAQEFKAKLYICHIVDLTSAAIYGDALPAIQDQVGVMTLYAKEQLEGLMKDRRVDWEPVIAGGHASAEIARIASENGVDLIVSATQGRTGLKRLVLGSVTERLMRTVPCPMLVVRSPEQGLPVPPEEVLNLKRIVAAYDFSPDSARAFQYGLSLAQEFQSELHLVHVIEPGEYEDILKPSKESGQKVEKALGHKLDEQLAAMVPDEAKRWCSPVTALLAGLPHEEITKYAVLHDMDLIVMGVRGTSLVEGLLVGSTTDRVIRHAPCPVLSVSPALSGDGKPRD